MPIETNTEISARYFHKFFFAHCFAHSSCKKHLLVWILQSPVAFLTDWSVTSLSWVLPSYVSRMLPLQYSCLDNPMDRGGWPVTVCRVAKSQTGLKWLSMHVHVMLLLLLLLSHTHTHRLQRKIKMYFLCKHPFATGLFSYFEMWSPYPRVSAGGVFCPSVAEATLNAQHSWQWLQQERQNAARHWCLAPYTKPSPLSARPLHSLPRWGIWDTGF